MSNAHAEHPMRRIKQKLSPQECRDVLARGTSGVLALKGGTEDFPYAVPLSYVYLSGGDTCALAGSAAGVSPEGSIFFHCAREGMKLDLLAKDVRASFCVIDQDQVVPERFTTYFRSVIAFGEVHAVEDRSRARAALQALGRKYSPGREDALEKEIDGAIQRTTVVELVIDGLTGKQARELVSADMDL